MTRRKSIAMKTYKLISPQIGHLMNFQAKDDKEAAKYIEDHNNYHQLYGNAARTFQEITEDRKTVRKG